MTTIIVSVRRVEDLEPTKAALAEFGDIQNFTALKKVFILDIGDGDEAMAMLALSALPGVTGAINGEQTMKPEALETEFIFEGRDAKEKAGALRLKATMDTDKPTFNNWWEQPNFFKWRKDSERLGQDVMIAIVDGGIRTGHPEFAKNPSRITRVHNAYTTDFGASNHGTACASFAAGDTIGTAPLAELLDVKISNSAGDPVAATNIVAGLDALMAWVTTPGNNPDDKFVIVNISLGSGGVGLANSYGTIIQEMEDIGMIPIIAAGNDGSDLGTTFDAWPAENSDYAIGAIQLDGRRAEFSNYGGRVKFYGFGSRVVGAGYPSANGYDVVNGTSFAAPYFCGCLATWLSGKYRPTDAAAIKILMTDYEAFCQEGIFGNSVRGFAGSDTLPGTVIGRASYFPVLPGNVIVPNTSIIASFGTADQGVLAWKTRLVAQVGGAPVGSGGILASTVAFFEGPFFADADEGPWLDPLYVPTGWSIGNDRVKHDGGSTVANKFVVSKSDLIAKEYWEVQAKSATTGLSVGVTLASNLANYDEATTGIGDAGFEWFADGSLTVDGVAQTAISTYADGDILMLSYDVSTGDFWVGKNGVWEDDPEVDPATGSMTSGASRAAIGMADDGCRAQMLGAGRFHAYNDTTDYTGFDIGSGIGAETQWVLDTATFNYAGHVYAEGDTRLTNATGGTNYKVFVPTIRSMPDSYAGKIYWEFHCNTLGGSSYNGYHSVLSAEARAARLADMEADVNPIGFGSLARRGNGTLWDGNSGFGSGTQDVLGLADFGANDVLMMCFDPSTAKIWTGVNGVWDDDPDTDGPTYTGPVASAEFYICLQGRNANQGGRLVSLSNEMTYTLPTGATPLGLI